MHVYPILEYHSACNILLSNFHRDFQHSLTKQVPLGFQVQRIRKESVGRHPYSNIIASRMSNPGKLSRPADRTVDWTRLPEANDDPLHGQYTIQEWYHSRGLLESRARSRAGNAGTYKQGGKAITQSGLLLVGSRFTEQGSYLGVIPTQSNRQRSLTVIIWPCSRLPGLQAGP